MFSLMMSKVYDQRKHMEKDTLSVDKNYFGKLFKTYMGYAVGRHINLP